MADFAAQLLKSISKRSDIALLIVLLSNLFAWLATSTMEKALIALYAVFPDFLQNYLAMISFETSNVFSLLTILTWIQLVSLIYFVIASYVKQLSYGSIVRLFEVVAMIIACVVLLGNFISVVGFAHIGIKDFWDYCEAHKSLLNTMTFFMMILDVLLAIYASTSQFIKQ